MRKFLLLILFVSSLFAKEIIAVLELEQKGLTKQEAEILTDRLTTKLISLDKYQVVERTNMDKILKEQKFQNSGCTDSECAVEIGQLLNTDFIVIGSVSKFGATYAVDARLIDVAKGKSLISAEFSNEGKIDILLTSGITSIASQLCELPYEEIVIASSKAKKKNKSLSDISDNTWSIGAGFLTNKGLNVLNISKDYKITKRISIFVSGGLPYSGIGVSIQNNYNNNGIIFGLSGGVMPDAEMMREGLRRYSSAILAYQWRLKRKNLSKIFISFGGGIALQEVDIKYDNELNEWVDVEPYWFSFIVPIISFDYRFNRSPLNLLFRDK